MLITLIFYKNFRISCWRMHLVQETVPIKKISCSEISKFIKNFLFGQSRQKNRISFCVCKSSRCSCIHSRFASRFKGFYHIKWTFYVFSLFDRILCLSIIFSILRLLFYYSICKIFPVPTSFLHLHFIVLIIVILIIHKNLHYLTSFFGSNFGIFKFFQIEYDFLDSFIDSHASFISFII